MTAKTAKIPFNIFHKTVPKNPYVRRQTLDGFVDVQPV